MKSEQPADEIQFCRELFAAMFEVSAEKTDLAKILYPYDAQTAHSRAEATRYYESCKRNIDCAKAIDAAIADSSFQLNNYNLELAAMHVIHNHGFSRINAVLARNLQLRCSDMRFSSANKKWAQASTVQEIALDATILNSHPTLIDSFTSYVRELCQDLNAERNLLPGRHDYCEAFHGYMIEQAVYFDNLSGFVIVHSPKAENPYATCQFKIENDRQKFYSEHYFDDFTTAAENYVTRVFDYMSDNPVREVPNHLVAMGTSFEQNYDLMDGLQNNRPYPKPDQTGRQTHEEIKTLAPKTLPEKMTSVLSHIREVQKTQRNPAEKKPPKHKKDKTERDSEMSL